MRASCVLHHVNGVLVADLDRQTDQKRHIHKETYGEIDRKRESVSE